MRKPPVSVLFAASAGGFTLLAAALPGAPVDIHLHDTYFVIAHAPIVLAAALVLAVLALVYRALPRLLRAPLHYPLGLLHALLTVSGLLLLLVPTSYQGIAGTPRRYYDYSGGVQIRQLWETHAADVVAVGALAAGQLLFGINVLASSLRRTASPRL